MAENSVHATQTLDSKPTIFELVAADSLQSTFEPALKRVAHVRFVQSISTSIIRIAHCFFCSRCCSIWPMWIQRNSDGFINITMKCFCVWMRPFNNIIYAHMVDRWRKYSTVWHDVASQSIVLANAIDSFHSFASFCCRMYAPKLTIWFDDGPMIVRMALAPPMR